MSGSVIIILSFYKQSDKWERHHILTQNLEAFGLWFISLIKCSSFTFSSDVRFILTLTHTHTWYLPIKYELIHSHGYAPLLMGFFSSILLTPSLDGLNGTRQPNTLVRKIFDIRRPSRTRLWYYCWIIKVSGDHHTGFLEPTTQVREILYINPKF